MSETCYCNEVKKEKTLSVRGWIAGEVPLLSLLLQSSAETATEISVRNRSRRPTDLPLTVEPRLKKSKKKQVFLRK